MVVDHEQNVLFQVVCWLRPLVVRTKDEKIVVDRNFHRQFTVGETEENKHKGRRGGRG